MFYTVETIGIPRGQYYTTLVIIMFDPSTKLPEPPTRLEQQLSGACEARVRIAVHAPFQTPDLSAGKVPCVLLYTNRSFSAKESRSTERNPKPQTPTPLNQSTLSPIPRGGSFRNKAIESKQRGLCHPESLKQMRRLRFGQFWAYGLVFTGMGPPTSKCVSPLRQIGAGNSAVWTKLKPGAYYNMHIYTCCSTMI